MERQPCVLRGFGLFCRVFAGPLPNIRRRAAGRKEKMQGLHTLCSEQSRYRRDRNRKRRPVMHEYEYTRAQSREALVSPQFMRHRCNEESAWFETPEEIEQGLRDGAERAVLLRRVRRVMSRVLTRRERECVRLHFFHGLSFRELGERTGSHASSAHRAICRAVRKLRAAFAEPRRIKRKARRSPAAATRRGTCARTARRSRRAGTGSRGSRCATVSRRVRRSGRSAAR